MKPRKEIDVRTEYAIARAKRIGTYDQIDRRAQYDGPDRAQPGALLEAVNALGTHTRGLKADADRMQQDLMNLKLRNAVVVAVITAVLARGPEIFAWLVRITQ
jgi:hypothetical protein